MVWGISEFHTEITGGTGITKGSGHKEFKLYRYLFSVGTVLTRPTLATNRL